MTKKTSNAGLLLGSVLAISCLSATNAAAQVYAASNGAQAGRVEFSVNSNTSTLTVRLFNTGQAFSQDTNDALTGLFFNISGATVSTGGSTVALGINSNTNMTSTYTGTGSIGTIGQQWARKLNVAAPAEMGSGFTPGTSNVGIAATTFGTLFNNATDKFTAGGPQLAGANFGLVNGSTSDTPYINNSVVFNFNLTGLTTATFSNIYFKYDTGPGVLLQASAVPEPMFVQLGSLLVMGGVGSVFGLRKRRKA